MKKFTDYRQFWNGWTDKWKRTKKKVYIPTNPHEKAMQRALIQYKNPQNRELVKEADVVAISGSVPKGLNGTAYQKLVTIVKDAGKKVILDTGKEKLDLEVEHVKFFKQFVIVKFKEFDNINDIERYKRCPLLVTRENAVPLEEDEYFVADMIGMKVITEDGIEFGTLSDVMETGANDVYVIDSKEHGEVLMPAIKECVLNVDMENGIITVHLMNGLI